MILPPPSRQPAETRSFTGDRVDTRRLSNQMADIAYSFRTRLGIPLRRGKKTAPLGVTHMTCPFGGLSAFLLCKPERLRQTATSNRGYATSAIGPGGAMEDLELIFDPLPSEFSNYVPDQQRDQYKLCEDRN